MRAAVAKCATALTQVIGSSTPDANAVVALGKEVDELEAIMVRSLAGLEEPIK